MNRPADVVIRCEGLCKAFAGKVVLRNLDFTVRRGETVVILGGSGSGKSVLLKHMNVLLRPDRGAVWFADQNLSELEEGDLPPYRRRIGMLFQLAALFDSMSVFDNVAYPIREWHLLPEPEIPARVRDLLDVVELEGTEHLAPSELSGGMRKRAGLARALALEPEVLLYDEPTTGLDPVVAQKINLLIRDLQRRFGLTSVVVTHDLHSAFTVADRIAFLHDGRIAFSGTPDEARRSTEPLLREFLDAAA